MPEQVRVQEAAVSAHVGLVRSSQSAAEQAEKALKSELGVDDGTHLDFDGETAKLVDSLDHQIEDLKGQIEDAKEADRARRSTLDRLQQEVKLHRLQGQHRALQARQGQLKQAKDNLGSLVALRESASAIRGSMERGLMAELRRDLGPVNDALTESFAALTGHPAYDRALVDPDLLPKLELRVGSSSEPLGKWDESVLNGQAASALGLVPYFAFSRLTGTPFEVHVMLLDDPTQSFDRDHVETLVAKLAQVGKTVQLVLSSHELGLFKDFIPKYFSDGGYTIMELNKFTIKGGPAI